MPDDSALDAVVLQVAELGGKVAGVERGLADIRKAIIQIRAATASEHEILRNLDGLDLKVAELDIRVRKLAARPGASTDDYQPVPTVRWWQIDAADREEAITRLRYWVAKIFVPGYGYLARMLPACWPQHEFCLYTVSWLSEIWSVVYLAEEPNAGTLAAMAELQTRLLPAAIDQIAREARDCGHGGDDS